MSGEQFTTIDQKIVISDLMDADLLRDFVGKFGEFTKLRIRLVDERSNIFITSGETPRFCMIAKGNERCRALCEEAGEECCWMPLDDDEPAIYECYCGLSYAVVRLMAEFEMVGRAIFGPFRIADTSISRKIHETGAPRSQLEHALEKIPLLPPEESKRIAKFFADCMDIFLFLSAKRLLTSRLHLETIFRAREQIFKDMENQMRSREDQEEIERLKQIF